MLDERGNPQAADRETLLERVVGIAAGRDDPDIRVALQDKDSEACLLAEVVRYQFRRLAKVMGINLPKEAAEKPNDVLGRIGEGKHERVS